MRDEIRCLLDGEIDLVAGGSAIKDGTSNTVMIVSRDERQNAAAIAVESEVES